MFLLKSQLGIQEFLIWMVTRMKIHQDLELNYNKFKNLLVSSNLH